MEATKLNGIQKQKPNPFVNIIQRLNGLTMAQLLTSASIVGALFAGFAFVNNTKNTNKDIPEIKAVMSAHEKEDNQDKVLFTKTLNEINISLQKVDSKIDLVNQKVDDMKAYGVGQYHQETRELIRKSK